MRFDGLLRPVTQRAVDLTIPGWPERLMAIRPLEEAGIESEVHTLLENLMPYYAQGTAQQREEVRALLQKCSAFRWAASFRGKADSADSFRMDILLLSACDLGSDTRDTILRLRHLCRVARGAGVDIAPILTEIAAISSDIDKYGMGSVRTLLLQER
jgi:hypothetical protein